MTNSQLLILKIFREKFGDAGICDYDFSREPLAQAKRAAQGCLLSYYEDGDTYRPETVPLVGILLQGDEAVAAFEVKQSSENTFRSFEVTPARRKMIMDEAMSPGASLDRRSGGSPRGKQSKYL